MRVKNLLSLLLIYSVLLVSCLSLIKADQNKLNDSLLKINSESIEPENDPIESEESLLYIEQIECIYSGINKIGESIAESYQTVDYEQVMLWFCNGAEFEDILLALETSEQSDMEAEELLIMLADGFTWEEIFLLIDFNY